MNGDQNLMQAIQAIAPLCNKPEQHAFLNTLVNQPAPVLEMMVKQICGSVNANDIPAMVDTEFAHLDSNLREQLKAQAVGAHNFLSQR
jgi:hypothetical protein